MFITTSIRRCGCATQRLLLSGSEKSQCLRPSRLWEYCTTYLYAEDLGLIVNTPPKGK